MQRAGENLIDFAIALNPKYEPNWHHELIAEKLEAVERGEIDRLAIFMPPRHGKSELASRLFPAWYLGRNPDKEIIACSYSSELASDFGRQVRNTVDDGVYRNIFDARLAEDSKARNRWHTSEKGAYAAVGVGGAITGRGANILIIDDPIKNEEEANSEVHREKVFNWYTSTAFTRLEKNGSVVLILTRWHKDDLAGRILEREEGWEVLSLPAIATKDEENRKEGQALWPEKYDVTSLDRIKAVMPKTQWSSLYQQNPIDAEVQEFHQEWFKYYDAYPSGLRIYTAVDPAFTKNRSSDESCIITVGFDRDQIYVLEYTAGKFDSHEMIEKIVYHTKKWRPIKIGIEAFQAQRVIGQFLKPKLQEQGLLRPIEEIRQTGDKESKIRKLVAPYRYGNVHHTRAMDKLEDQLISFPKGKHDDIIDAFQMVFDLYNVQPSTKSSYKGLSVTYNAMGQPIFN